MSHTISIPPRELADHFLSLGRYSFTLDEAAASIDASRGAAADALERLHRRGQVFSPARGLYVAIPPEYRSWGVLPGDWFIDAMMAHLGRSYYVALLTAAAAHGASHQAPQVFQVMTGGGAPVRDRDIGRVRLRFYASGHLGDVDVERVTVPVGYMTISTRETTVVDLVSHYRAAGGYDNVATILKEIGQLSGSALARIASARGRAVVRRTGWLVERYGCADDLEALRQAARLDLGEPALLAPARGRGGRTDRDWRLRLNATVEPDL